MVEMTGRPSDPAIIATYNNLAGLYREIGRSEEAAEWYRRALKMVEMTGRPGDPAIIATYNNLAGLYKDIGRNEEAIRWYTSALYEAQKYNGPQSAPVALQLNSLAEIFMEVRRVDEAESLLRRGLEILGNTLGHDTPVATRITNNLARLFEETGRRAEALEISAKARFDVFVSYNHHDSIFVRALVEKMTETGLRVWFDQWQLRPGDSIVRALRDAVDSASSFLVCIGQSGPGEWMGRELTQILTRREQRNQQIIPVLLPDGIPELMPPILLNYHFLDLRRGLNDEDFDRLLSSLKRRRRNV